MDKLLIIDGHNLLFQMFFGMPSKIISKDGKAIHGTLGFIGGLINIIKMSEPTHLIVIFDRDKGDERTAINADYKANRIDYSQVQEDNPFLQLPDIFKALDYMNIKYAEINGFEADDVVAGYAIRYHHHFQIVISSYDSDFYQLLNENIQILRYKGKQSTLFDTDKFREKYGIEPCYFADYKAIVGDNADNIRGIDKIGPKTAVKLINEYGTVNNIIEHADGIDKPLLSMSILNNKERMLQNIRLIKLEDKAPLPYAMDELRYFYRGLPGTVEILKKIGLR